MLDVGTKETTKRLTREGTYRSSHLNLLKLFLPLVGCSSHRLGVFPCPLGFLFGLDELGMKGRKFGHLHSYFVLIQASLETLVFGSQE